MKEYRIKDIQQKQLQILKEVVRICDENKVTYYAAYGTVLGAIRHKGFIPWDGDIDIYVPENELDTFIHVMKKNLGDEYVVDFRDDKKAFRDFPRIGYRGYETGLLHVDVFRLAGMPDDERRQLSILKRTRILHHIVNVKQKGLKLFFIQKRKIVRAFLVSLITAPISLQRITELFDKYNRKYPFEKAHYVGNCADDSEHCVFSKKYLGKGMIVQFEDTMIRIPEAYDEYLKQIYGNYMEYPPEKERNKVLSRVYREVINPENGLKTLILI